MQDISKLYLLGAGASYGHNEDIPEDRRPPLGDYIFIDGWERGILRDGEFSILFNRLIEYLDKRGNISNIKLSELECNTERFLQDMQSQFEEVKIHENRHPQTVLSLSYYYIYELFRRYTNLFSPDGSRYAELAEEFKESNYGVISLNYDCLFEKAVNFTGQEYHYLPQHSQKGSVPIAKIHGSVNLVSDFESGISVETDDFVEKARHLHSNRVWTNVTQLTFDKLEKLDYRDLVCQLDTHHEPAVVPPVGGGKDYEKLELYNEQQKFAAEMLSKVEEMVIIGSSLTVHDEELLELLGDNLSDDIEVTIVCGSKSKSVKSQLEVYLDDPKFNLDYAKFSEYVRNEL